jgi:hypothetical protein
VDLRFDVISVKQMSTAGRSSEGTPHLPLPLFLVTLRRTTKSQDLFKLSNLCHISIKVESYKCQDALTQCYNCQKFGHVWANCKQPPRCLWCGGGHMHRDCPEKENASSTPAAATANWLKERQYIPPTAEAAGMLRKKCGKRSPREHQNPQLEGCSQLNS